MYGGVAGEDPGPPMPMLPPRFGGSCALSVQVIRETMDKLQILRLFRSSDRDLAQLLRDFLVEAPIPMLLNNLGASQRGACTEIEEESKLSRTGLGHDPKSLGISRPYLRRNSRNQAVSAKR